MKNEFDNWINGLNNLQIGFVLVLFGLLFTLYFKYLHKPWKKEGYKPFKPFRRQGKTQSEDNFVIVMYMRTLLGIYGGFLIVFLGILKILTYFKLINL